MKMNLDEKALDSAWDTLPQGSTLISRKAFRCAIRAYLSALEATPPTPKVTDAMAKAFQEKYREFWKGSWPDSETSRELLKAAMEAGKP